MELKSQPLVTILTPVYNGKKYLADSIESVLSQTYENWEYIIVNNCSTDQTLQIAQAYAEKDSRIRIHNNKRFLALIENHNNAVRQMSPDSKYSKMLHADDLLFPDCVMLMVKLAEENPSVGVVGSYWLHGDRVPPGLSYPKSIISAREICRRCLLGTEDIFGTPTTTLIRSDIIRAHETFYNESNLAADKEAIYKALQNSDFGFVQQILTYYRLHEEQAKRYAPERIGLFLSKIFTLQKYGHIYLTSHEYRKVLQKSLKNYYKFIAFNFFIMMNEDYRQANKRILSDLQLRFSLSKFLFILMSSMFNALLNPKNTVEKLVLRFLKGV